MGDQFYNYAWLAFVAWVGVLARAARWTTPEGKFSIQKCVFECLTAPAIGMITAAVGRYINPDMDPVILSGMAALLGLLGPAAIEAAFFKWFEKKIGL